MNIRAVDGIVEKYEGKRDALISMLHDIQNQYHHLPERALRRVALRLKMDFSDIYGVVTFLQVIQPDSQREAFSNPLPGNGLPRAGRPKILRGGQRG